MYTQGCQGWNRLPSSEYLDRSDLLSSGEVYSGIVQSNPSSYRFAAVEGQQLARDGYMVS